MDDSQIHDHIEQLVAEERGLYERAGHGEELTADERARLESIKIELDRFWDLLRQRKALQEYGRDPSDASLRSADTVEGYEG